MTSAPMGNLIIKLFVLSVGLMLLLPAYKLYSYIRFRYQSVSVTGIITRPSRGRDLGARPVVEYMDLQGNTHEIKSNVKTHWIFAPEKGEKVNVFFLKNAPEMAIVDSLFYYVLLPLCFMAIGAGMVLFAFKKSCDASDDHSESTFGV